MTGHRLGQRARSALAHLAGISLLAGLLPLLAISSAQAAEVYEKEDNGEQDSANSLPLGAVMHATSKGFAPSWDAWDDDFYYVDAAQAGWLTVEFGFQARRKGDFMHGWLVSAYDHSGGYQYSFEPGDSRDLVPGSATLRMFVPGGRFYLWVASDDEWASWGVDYTLKATMTPGAAPSPAATARTPIIEGTFKVDGFLYADTGDWQQSGVKLSYQWLRDGKAIPGATSVFYEVEAADVGHKLSVRVTGSNPGHPSVSKTSAATLVPGKKLSSTPKPTISGTAKFGKKLTAKAHTWKPSGVKKSYQWLRDGKAIKGATKSTYKLVAADVKHRISVRVTGSKTGYTPVSKTSKATKRVVALKLTKTPAPRISGTAKMGATLTARVAAWKPSGVTTSYQWYRNGKKVAGATGKTYVVAKADKGKKLTVTVTGKKSGYKAVTKTSKPTKTING